MYYIVALKFFGSFKMSFKVAVIQDSPIVFNLAATIDKVETLTNKAISNGAELVLFPEAFISAYPKGLDFGARVGQRSDKGREDFRRYYDSSLDFKKENSQINLIHTNIKKNVLAAKRNHGISLSKGEIIVLLDDDCIPEQNFLNTYLELFKSIDNKTVFCGIVDYPNEIVKKNNYVRYRKSRHFGEKTNNKILDKQIKRIGSLNEFRRVNCFTTVSKTSESSLTFDDVS